MPYVPKPVDTSKTVLPPELLELTERLAENTHEVWAQQRLAEGWTPGPTRNDSLKQHPCLVPYADLSEAEKEYDRRTALETLRLIVYMGYEVRRKETRQP